MSTANYNALAGTPLTRGRAVADGTTIFTATPLTADVMCVSDTTLVVEVDMTGAAAGDLAVEVRPFEADNATVQVNQLPPVRADGPDLVSGHVYYYAQYDVSAVEKVRIVITNNNAGSQTVTRASWRLVA